MSEYYSIGAKKRNIIFGERVRMRLYLSKLSQRDIFTRNLK